MFKQFNKTIIKGLNIMDAKLSGLLRMRSDKYINISRAGNGTTLSLNVAEVRRSVSGNGSNGDSTSKAFVKTAPGAVTTVDCFLREDTTGTEITVNCSVIGGSGSEKLNDAVPRLVDGSLIFVKKFSDGYWCTFPFIATDDCKCVDEDPIFNSVAIASDQKLGLDGGVGDTFLRLNSVDGEVEHTVDGTTVTTW